MHTTKTVPQKLQTYLELSLSEGLNELTMAFISKHTSLDNVKEYNSDLPQEFSQ